MIHVPDVRATVEWYESIGFSVAATYADETGNNYSFAIVTFGDSEVMFNTDGESSDKWRREVDLYLYVENVDEIYESLKDRVDVVEGPHDKFYGMREVIVRDLNRFWITFGQESFFALLMSGIYGDNPDDVRRALDSGVLSSETLNIALGFASHADKRNEQIIELLTAAGAQPLPSVDSATLESYVGTYQSEHRVGAEITINDGRLFVTPRGQQTMSLWPLDQVTFRLVALADSTLVFDVENGKVSGLSFAQGGYKMKLKRVASG